MGSNFLTITGVRKVGGTWVAQLLGAQCNQLPLFPSSPSTIRLRLDWVFQAVSRTNQEYKCGLSAQDIAMRLVDPAGVAAVSAIAQELPLVSQCLYSLAARLRFALSLSGIDPQMSIPAIRDALIERLSNGPVVAEEPHVCLTPAKHIPLNFLRTHFGQFRPVWVLRDPRDTLVSWIYHDLRTLSPSADELEDLCGSYGGTYQERTKSAPEWLLRLIQLHTGDLVDFYERCRCPKETAVIVKYEEALINPQGTLERLLESLGIPASSDRITAAIRNFSFARLTGGLGEVRNSFVRKGTQGEWRVYLDQRLARAFSPYFEELAAFLGYEPSERWIEHLPPLAPQEIDISRVSVSSAAVYSFQNLWLQNTWLQERFPCVFQNYEHGSFYGWLRSCRIPEVERWFSVADRFANDCGAVDQERHPADAIMGY